MIRELNGYDIGRDARGSDQGALFRGTARALAAVARAIVPGSRCAVVEPVVVETIPKPWWKIWGSPRTYLRGGVVEVIVMTKGEVADDVRLEVFEALKDNLAAGIELRLRFVVEV